MNVPIKADVLIPSEKASMTFYPFLMNVLHQSAWSRGSVLMCHERRWQRDKHGLSDSHHIALAICTYRSEVESEQAVRTQSLRSDASAERSVDILFR